MLGPLGEPVRFESASAWREWLQVNHASSREAWMVVDKKGPGSRTVPYEEALDEATCFGWVDGMVRGRDESSYLMRWTPRRPRSSWTDGNRARAARLIAEGRMSPAGLATLPEELRTALS